MMILTIKFYYYYNKACFYQLFVNFKMYSSRTGRCRRLFFGFYILLRLLRLEQIRVLLRLLPPLSISNNATQSKAYISQKQIIKFFFFFWQKSQFLCAYFNFSFFLFVWFPDNKKII